MNLEELPVLTEAQTLTMHFIYLEYVSLHGKTVLLNKKKLALFFDGFCEV